MLENKVNFIYNCVKHDCTMFEIFFKCKVLGGFNREKILEMHMHTNM